VRMVTEDGTEDTKAQTISRKLKCFQGESKMVANHEC
jgi:hypothetical protein